MIVDNTPKFLARDPTDKSHALTLEDPDHLAQTVTLPLALQGVTSLLNVRAQPWTNGIVTPSSGYT